MKSSLKLSFFLLLIVLLFYISCKKEFSCENCLAQNNPTNKPPVANAGTDQIIVLPGDSVMLDGSASSDPDGVIISYKWAKVSGPVSSNILKTDSSKTLVKTLGRGVYKFELTVKDNGGLSGKDTVQVVVNDPAQPNRPPVADAGPEQAITLPVNSVTLDGSNSSDPDNNITTYAWTKISGPSSFTISNTNTVQPQVTNLVQGIYQFELKVTDAGGLFSKDTMMVIVTATQTDPGHWTRLQYLPENEFFFAPRYWFGGSNFLFGIDYKVFAVSNKGNVWLYDTLSNSWAQIGVFPEFMTTVPFTFTINGKGYCIGNGHCWEYDPVTNQWTRKNDPPNYVIDPLVINNKAYLRSTNNQMLAYDPLTDTYTQKNNHPDLGNSLLGLFVLSSQGYYIGQNGQCWKYDYGTDSWQQEASFSWAGVVNNTSSFFLNNYGYIIGDLNGAAYNFGGQMKVWRYDPSLNQWGQISQNYPGDGAYEINTVSFNGIVYVGIGYNNGDFNAIDFWSFK